MKNQEALTELIAEVLDQDLVDISIRSFKVFEAFESGRGRARRHTLREA